MFDNDYEAQTACMFENSTNGQVMTYTVCYIIELYIYVYMLYIQRGSMKKLEPTVEFRLCRTNQ